jgi:hypothetical protein
MPLLEDFGFRIITNREFEMISQALALSILTFAGFYMIFDRLPDKVKQFTFDHQLIANIALTVGTYALLGGTLTALFAAAVVDLMVRTSFYISNHRESFQYLYDFCNVLKDKFQQFQVMLQEYGKQYNSRKGINNAHQNKVSATVPIGGTSGC